MGRALPVDRRPGAAETVEVLAVASGEPVELRRGVHPLEQAAGAWVATESSLRPAAREGSQGREAPPEPREDRRETCRCGAARR